MINLSLAAELAAAQRPDEDHSQRLTMRPRFLKRCASLSLIAVLLACPRQAADPVLAPSGTLRAAYIGR
jgi:hypothetical protein